MNVHLNNEVPSQDPLLAPTLVPVGPTLFSYTSYLLTAGRDQCLIYCAKNLSSSTKYMLNHICGQCDCFQMPYSTPHSLGPLSSINMKSYGTFPFQTLSIQELYYVNFYSDFYHRHTSCDDPYLIYDISDFICDFHDLNTIAPANRRGPHYTTLSARPMWKLRQHHRLQW